MPKRMGAGSHWRPPSIPPCWPSYVYLCFLVCLFDPLCYVHVCVCWQEAGLFSSSWAQALVGWEPWWLGPTAFFFLFVLRRAETSCSPGSPVPGNGVRQGYGGGGWRRGTLRVGDRGRKAKNQKWASVKDPTLSLADAVWDGFLFLKNAQLWSSDILVTDSCDN